MFKELAPVLGYVNDSRQNGPFGINSLHKGTLQETERNVR